MSVQVPVKNIIPLNTLYLVEARLIQAARDQGFFAASSLATRGRVARLRNRIA